MPAEYKTLRFPRTQAGWKEKDRVVNELAVQGWRVASESIAPGQLKGEKACCLASICLPLGFMAGQTPGAVVVTLVRDSVTAGSSGEQGSHRFCGKCGRQIEPGGNFCDVCGTPTR